MADETTYNNNIRRWFHFLFISTFALIFGFSSLTWQTLLLPLGIATLVFVSLDLIRLHIPYLNWLAQNTFTFILRKHEFHSISGASWFLIGAIISIIIFPKPIAVLGFLYLAAGDPSASYAGIRWGKRDIGEKSWMGCFAFFMVCWAIGNLYLWALLPYKNFIYISSISAFIAAFTESNLKDMDDNFIIPIVSSTMIYLLCLILG
jgi:dolichol kinase